MIRLVPVLLLLAGCVSTQEARDNATRAWTACIVDAVVRLDDGRTDPISMAAAIAPNCAAQYYALSQTMTGQFVTERGQANMRQEMRAGELRLIASSIVEHRARLRR